MKLLVSLLVACFASGAAAQAPVSFSKQIKPILRTRCQGCHQPASQGGKLVLTTYQAFLAGGAAGPGFKPGKPDESVTLRFIAGNPPLMPKNQKPLSAAEVDLFRRWISEGARDDTPRIVDPIGPKNPPRYSSAPAITALAWSPDGATIAVNGFREVLLVKADGTGIAQRLVGRSKRIESVAFSPDGQTLAAVGGSPALFGEVQFWNVAKGEMTNAVELSYDVLYGAQFSPDGTSLSVGSADNAVRIVSAPEGKLLLKFDNHSDWVFATAWATDNKHLLSTGRDRAIKLIVAANGSFVDDINTHTSPFRALARVPKQDHVIAVGEDGIARRYQVFRTKARTMNQEDHNLLKAFDKFPAPANALAISADGKRLAIAGESSEAWVFDIELGARLSKAAGLGPSAFAAAFSPDGAQVAFGGHDGTLRIFNAETGALVREMVPVPLNAARAPRAPSHPRPR